LAHQQNLVVLPNRFEALQQSPSASSNPLSPATQMSL
jgi:hypothetical protein